MIDVYPSDVFGMVGTSLTAGDDPGSTLIGQPRGIWRDVLSYGFALYRGPNLGTSAGLSTAPFAGLPPTIAKPTVINWPTLAQVGSARVATNVANFATLVPGNVTIGLIEGNVNDAFHDTPEQDYRDGLQELFALYKAAGARHIAMLLILYGYVTGVVGTTPGEQWSNYAADPFQLKLDQYNTWATEELATQGAFATTINLRTAIKVRQPIVNPGDLGSGVDTSDGVHIREGGPASGVGDRPLGLWYIGQQLRPHFRFWRTGP